AQAIGVVAQQRAIVELVQRIYRPGATRTLGQLVGQPPGLFLEGHGDIGATAVHEEPAREAGEILQRRQQRLIAERLARLLGEQPVDLRRLAVADGIAAYAVAVHEVLQTASDGLQ